MIFLDPEFHLVEEKRAPFYTPFEKEVEERWQQGIAADKLLFDGPVFRPTSFNPKEMVGDFIPYRYFYAQSQGVPLSIHTVGVTGIIQKEDRVLLGLRSDKMAYEPGKWEFAPSGTLSTLDIEELLLGELQEELGVMKVREMIPFLLVQEGNVFDICFKIDCDLPEKFPQEEYKEVVWVPLSLLASFQQANPTVKSFSHLVQSFLE